MSEENTIFYKEQEEYEFGVDSHIIFDDVKSIKVNTLPSNIWWDAISLFDYQKNQLYPFLFTTILKKGNLYTIF